MTANRAQLTAVRSSDWMLYRWRDPAGRIRGELLPAFLLLGFEIAVNRLEVIIELCSVSRTHPSHLGHNRIFPHRSNLHQLCRRAGEPCLVSEDGVMSFRCLYTSIAFRILM
jgi:hypothetical protein